MAVTAAKEIKTVTGLSKTPVTIGTLTANEVFAFPKESKNVLIIGITGKIGSIAAKNILKKPGINLTGTSRRHFEDKLHSSYPDIQLIDFTKRYEYIDEADIIISATSSPHYTVTKDELIRHTHIKKERLFIDLAVPADIDSDVGSLEMCRLFDIDYFRTLSESNNTRRLKEAASAGEYAEKWTDDIIKELEYHRIIESLPQLKSIVENHGLEHLVYSLRKLADRSQTEAARQWFDNYIKEWSR